MHRSSAFPWTWVESRIAGNRSNHLFESVRNYVMFIGQPRSGTSLLGSLLNAHRSMSVAQELNALRYIRRGYDRNQLFWLLLKKDGHFNKLGRQWTGYDYAVANQWQGRFDKLQVIGDKKAGVSSEQLRRSPKLLDKVQRIVQVPVKIIHVVRDPFNVITTIHKKRKRTSLAKAARMFFARTETNWRLMQERGDMIKTLRLENLIAKPEQHLQGLCEFLDVEPEASYIRDCAEILFEKPRQSKGEIPWSGDVLKYVQEQTAKYPFLEGYTYGGGLASKCRKAA